MTLVSCGGGDTTTETTDEATTTEETTTEETAEEEPVAEEPAETEDVAEEPAAEEPAAEEPTEEPAAEPAEEMGEAITLRYANWNLGTEEENNIQRQMVQAYMEAHPNVTVEFVDMSAEGGWDAVLTSYAAKGELPDVFMANNVPLYVANGWLADLTELTAADADWANIPQALRDGVTYNGQVLGIPAAQFVMGYFVNKDLYEAANLDAPEYGFTVEEFNDAVTALNNIPQGVLGLDEMEFVMGWYANSQDSNLKWFSFDGQHMNYNSAAFKEAVATAGEMKQYTWQGLSEEQLANFTATGPWELFLNQEVGMRWDASWSVPGYVENATFDWDFIGVPGGNQALVSDIIVVSQTAADVAAAYDFARWMTFSTEAYAKEAELAAALGSAPKMPVSVDEASLALYTQFVDKPGILAALDNLDNSMVESLAKIVPGYINARWEGKPGIDIGEDLDVNMWFMFNFANDGRYKYEDYSAQLETFANQILDDAAAELSQ
ncbi:MAG: extracellular solute-binding protein [Ardenticatenaceae bacterium]|nr:extracellular solute-binding protein [Ardenticatenaceae bacterium]MCB8975613.1 extracellular solute-binding protein [Ardenticatenaceae bacterium]